MSEAISVSAQFSQPVYFDQYCNWWSSGFYWTCSVGVYVWEDDAPPSIPPGNQPILNHEYSDEQCQEQYGSVSVLVSESYLSSGGSIDVGACSLTPQGGVGFYSKYNAQGEEAPDGMLYYTNDFNATSTGEVNQPGAGVESSDDLPDYLTPAPDCQVNCVTFDGTTYQVDQSEIDTGNVTLGTGNTGGGSDDGGDSTSGGSDDGGSSGGSSGGDSGSDDGTDGGSSGGGSDGGDSGGSSGGGSGGSGGGSGGTDGGTGDTGNDDGLGLGDVIDAINGGFNGLVDKIAGVTDTVDGVKDAVDEGNQAAEDRFNAIADSAPTEADLDAQFGSTDEHQGLMKEALNGAGETLTDYIDGTDSTFSNLVEGMKDLARSAIPEIPSPSCQPLVFAPGKVYSITIDCEIFEIIRSALAWILYVLTAWIMLSTMFASRPH